MTIDDERAMLWLCACTNFTNGAKAKLLREAKSPKNLFYSFEKYASAVEEASPLLKGGLARRQEETEKLLSQLERENIFFFTPMSEDYPESLKALHDPPLLLFGFGRRELLQTKKFCVVGSRITPPYAEKLGAQIAREVSGRMTIVTGLAEGGDRAAISGAIKSGNLICVLPNGLNECYPAAHASLKKQVGESGLLLSEYPPDEKTRKYSFFARNRVLAGLSVGTLVISAGKRSGALITANRAAEYGRDVFALPYNAGISQGAGCNELIKQGAYCCTEAEDILSFYGFSAPQKQQEALDEGEERVLKLLREEGELHIASIADKAQLKIYEASAALASLEIKGLVVKTGGNKYSAV